MLAQACTGGAPDSDGDGVADDADNCTHDANADQRDTDADGFGNVCDGDFDQSCTVNFSDLGIMKASFFQPGTTHTDMNGDGQTNFTDLGLLKARLLPAAGPERRSEPLRSLNYLKRCRTPVRGFFQATRHGCALLENPAYRCPAPNLKATYGRGRGARRRASRTGRRRSAR